MDAQPTPFPPATKPQSLKSKYKRIYEPPKLKIKEEPTQRFRHSRTFATLRNPNIQEITASRNPKPKAPKPKTDPQILIAPVPKTKSGKNTSQNGSIDTTSARRNNKKNVSFTEKGEGSVGKNSAAREVDGVKTPVRPPFSVKPVRIPGTPYLSAEKCSSCGFDRLETASYWLGQIKSSESVGKHFVSVAFFRLAHDCKAEPVQNLEKELSKYLSRHQHLCDKTEWKDVSRVYGIPKKEHETKSNEDCKLVDITNVASTTN